MFRRRVSFVLRLWTESGSSADLHLALRGSLQRVDSSEVRYFDSFDDIPEMLREELGWPSPPNAPVAKDRDQT